MIIPVNPSAIGDPDQTPVVYIGDAGEVLGIPERAGVDLDEVRRRVEAATPGPWWAWDRGVGWELALGTPADVDQYGRPVLYLPQGINEDTLTESDARFIAAARSDVPALLADLDSVREQLRQAQIEISTLTNNYRVAAEEEEAAKAERDAARAEIQRLTGALTNARATGGVVEPGQLVILRESDGCFIPASAQRSDEPVQPPRGPQNYAEAFPQMPPERSNEGQKKEDHQFAGLDRNWAGDARAVCSCGWVGDWSDEGGQREEHATHARSSLPVDGETT